MELKRREKSMKTKRLSLHRKVSNRVAFMSILKRSMEPFSKRLSVSENGSTRLITVTRRGLGIIQTSHGRFWQYDFSINDEWKKYSVIVAADLDSATLNPVFDNKHPLILRIDSGCETGQVFGDITCECSEQLHLAMETIAENGEGLIVHIPRQDGRGKDLPFKLATLWLQDELGMDTVESANFLTHNGSIDIRTYSGVIGILKFFCICDGWSVNLATNNPKKADIFIENSYIIYGYTPVVIMPTRHTIRHLRAKEKYLGHQGLVSGEIHKS